MFVYQTADFVRFFLAFSFYPGRGDTGNTFLTTTVVPATTVVPGNDQINITDGESEVESMTDWLEPLDEPGPALRRQSKTLDAMAVEVCLQRL